MICGRLNTSVALVDSVENGDEDNDDEDEDDEDEEEQTPPVYSNVVTALLTHPKIDVNQVGDGFFFFHQKSVSM